MRFVITASTPRSSSRSCRALVDRPDRDAVPRACIHVDDPGRARARSQRRVEELGAELVEQRVRAAARAVHVSAIRAFGASARMRRWPRSCRPRRRSGRARRREHRLERRLDDVRDPRSRPSPAGARSRPAPRRGRGSPARAPRRRVSSATRARHAPDRVRASGRAGRPRSPSAVRRTSSSTMSAPACAAAANAAACSRGARSGRRGGRARAPLSARPARRRGATSRRDRAARGEPDARPLGRRQLRRHERAHLVRRRPRSDELLVVAARHLPDDLRVAPSPFADDLHVLGPNADFPVAAAVRRELVARDDDARPRARSRRRATVPVVGVHRADEARRRTSSPARGTALRGSAYCSTLPPDMTAMRSEIDIASSWSWVTKTVVMPMRRWICGCPRAYGRAASRRGSTAARRAAARFGSSTSARASATRCCSPPEIRAG